MLHWEQNVLAVHTGSNKPAADSAGHITFSPRRRSSSALSPGPT
jgi:hypothetical protein